MTFIDILMDFTGVYQYWHVTRVDLFEGRVDLEPTAEEGAMFEYKAMLSREYSVYV